MQHEFLAQGPRDVNPGSQLATIWLDEWIDKQLAVLAWRISRLGGDQIALHYWKVGRAEYAIYQRLRCPRARWRAQRAISNGLRWVSQLNRGWLFLNAQITVSVGESRFRVSEDSATKLIDRLVEIQKKEDALRVPRKVPKRAGEIN